MPSSSFSAVSSSPDPASAALVRYGWDAFCADAFAPWADTGLTPGRIVRVDRGRCAVVTADGVVHAGTGDLGRSDPTELPCTGDWAVLDRDPAGRRTVTALLPRRTAFLRSGSSKSSHGQVLAANVDLAVIAVSLADELVLGRVERFVALAWSSGAQPMVALTKADLVPEPGPLLADTELAAPGTPVLAVSAHTGEGVGELAALLAGRTSVLLGVSGAGKSTLANALLGEERQVVRAVRDSDGRGRHTTTSRELLPLPGGGVLIDTPGLRGVGMWDAEEGVSRAFGDIEALAAGCRFTDCGHHGEPGCAVRAAVEDGSLGERRLASYRKLLRESARLAARTDARLRAEQRREWKQRSAVGRYQAERKYGSRRAARESGR